MADVSAVRSARSRATKKAVQTRVPAHAFAIKRTLTRRLSCDKEFRYSAPSPLLWRRPIEKLLPEQLFFVRNPSIN